MAYWLFKSEPGNWSWDDQVKRGAKGDEWDGVRNHTAKLNILAMKPGDFGYFYHSVDEKRIVGIAKIISEPHPDPTDETGTWFSVKIAADTPLPRPITLAEIRREPRLAEMALVKQSRLSVQPVTEDEWEIICTMAAVKKAPKSAAKAPAKTAAKAPAKSAAKAPAKTVAAKKPAASKTAKAAPKTAAKPAAKPAAKKTAAKKPAAKGSKK
jgi:predicted RNA-binding protein with PUA-like domain